MLAKNNRFHGHTSIKKVYRQGKTNRNKLGSLHFVKLDGGEYSKVAVVVSKKVNKSAVARNRIRRRVFEIIRQGHIANYQGHALVFTVFLPEAESIDHRELKRLVDDLLSSVPKTS